MNDIDIERTRRRNDDVQMFVKNQEPPAEVAVHIDAIDIRATNKSSCEFVLAVLAGDKKRAVKIFSYNADEVVETPIGWNGETAFHMAVMAANDTHVAVVMKELLCSENMRSEFLSISTPFGTNALHYAAISGNLEIAQKIHFKNLKLANTTNIHNVKPIYMAALAGHGDVVQFLLDHTTFDIHDGHGSSVLNLCISSGLFGLAVKLIKIHNQSAVTRDRNDKNGETPLEVFARVPSAVHKDGSTKASWRKLIRSKESSRTSVNELLDEIWPILKESDLYTTSYLQNLLLTAAENGNHEFIVYLLGRYPGLVYSTNESKHTIFQIAILHRHEEIFTLIHEIGSLGNFLATYIDVDNNSMLHLAARLSPPDQLYRIDGAALQIQRELLWYKEVEKIVPPTYVKLLNSNGHTPHDIFIDEHLELMKAGEKWMRRTTKYSMVFSILIAIMVFSVTFPIIGGVNSNGALNFKTRNFLDMFLISDIIAILFSFVSIVMYLCILTSHYTEKDFLVALPLWLIIGSTSLFISLTAMLVAFCNAFLVFEGHDKHYVHILLGFLAVAPVMFIWFKYPLVADIMKTTTSSKSLSRSSGKLFPRKQWCG